MALSEQEKQLLVRQVADIEARTGAEVVTTLVAKCDTYPEIPWKAFALGMSVAAAAIGVLSTLDGGWATPSPILLATLLLGSALLPALLTVVWPGFARLFLTRSRAQGEVQQYAESLFLKQELFRTRSRCGILMLVALFEHQVVIVPDRGVRARVAPQALGGVVARMIPLLAAGRTAQAFEAGLAALDDVLRAQGVVGAAGDNELPDHLNESRKE